MGKKRVAKQTKEEILKESADAGIISGREKAVSVEKSVKVGRGNIYVRASYNNVMITITDEQGRVLSWASSGAAGFRGPRKATPFAASKVFAMARERLGKITVGEVTVLVRGTGAGRDAALRAIAASDLHVKALRDGTPVPHNGCRPKKARRV